MENLDEEREKYNKNLLDKLTQSPVEKFQYHNRFPWKLILTILLILGTSYEGLLFQLIRKKVTLNNQSIDTLDRNLLFTMNLNIFPQDNQDYMQYSDSTPQVTSVELETLKDLSDSINLLLQTMGNLNDILYANIDQKRLNETKQEIEVFYWSRDIFEEQLGADKFYFTIAKGIQDPFDPNDLKSIKDFLIKSHRIIIKFTNIKFENYDSDFIETWDLQMTYDVGIYTITAQLTGQRKTTNRKTFNEDKYDYKYYSQNWLIYLTVMILSLCSFILNIKYIFDLIELYTRTKVISQYYYDPSVLQRKRNTENIDLYYLSPIEDWYQKFDVKGKKQLQKIIESKRPWSSLSYEEKMLFIDSWIIIQLISNILQFFSSFLLLFPFSGVSGTPLRYLLGISCFTSWLNICKFIEYFESIYTTTYLLQRAFPTILRYLLGVLPIFIGFAILGLTFFYRAFYYSCLNQSILSLVSIAFGDRINESMIRQGKTFACLKLFYNMKATIFTFIFTCIFAMVFQNIFVAIVVSIVKDKFDAESRQEMIDYLRQKIPDLDFQLQNGRHQNAPLTSDNLKQINLQDSIMSSMILKRIPSKNENLVVQQDQLKKYFDAIKKQAKHIESSIKKTLEQASDDIRIHIRRDPMMQSTIYRIKFQCLEQFLLKTKQMSFKAQDQMNNLFKKQQ